MAVRSNWEDCSVWTVTSNVSVHPPGNVYTANITAGAAVVYFNSFTPGPNDWKQFCVTIQQLAGDEEAIIKFEFVQSTKSKNIDQNEPETELELLAIDLFKREHNFEITLLFSKNRFITLTSEIIEAVLEDQKIENDKSN